MPEVSLRIPQIGEGLQEARLVAVLKQPGDLIKRDEPIYQMETDKAVMDVESPYEGKLVGWLAEVDAVLPIGAEVARMETEDEVQEMVIHGAPAEAAKAAAPMAAAGAATGNRRRDVPPRTRAYAKQKGLDDDDLEKVKASGARLMPADIDAYLANGASAGPKKGEGYSEVEMSSKQRVLASRLQRGSQLAVPGTESVVCNWGPMEALREKIKSGGGEFQPSSFTMFSFCVAQALKDFPGFRSTIVGDSVIRTYDHVNLGIAVALPGDELVIAKVEKADALDWREFADAMRERIEHARAGNDQADESVTISLTNMQSFGLRDAVAVVVPPGVATLFIGEPYNGLDQTVSELKLQRCANMGLTFDHRLINGVGAAQLLNAVREKVENIGDLVQA
ncbi:MAG TPA: 2-oxo acid dehydrogenase subunit E2 [Fimbriimonadaceae bacterium]|nr:2-oxo acid dehydrogenase subunit E2 [Fimbriimonadaceae bacterium]